jgi:hypothetical protein
MRKCFVLSLLILAALSVSSLSAADNFVTLRFIDLSPAYEWNSEMGDKDFAPVDPELKDRVTWQNDVPFVNGVIDLLGKSDRNENAAVYGRIIVMAEKECTVDIGMGSDDGLKAWLNGEDFHTNLIMRGVTANEDQMQIDLKKGINVLLFRVTQGGGGFGLQVSLNVTDGTKVTQLEAAEAKAIVDQAKKEREEAEKIKAAEEAAEKAAAASKAEEDALPPPPGGFGMTDIISLVCGLIAAALFIYLWKTQKADE